MAARVNSSGPRRRGRGGDRSGSVLLREEEANHEDEEDHDDDGQEEQDHLSEDDEQLPEGVAKLLMAPLLPVMNHGQDAMNLLDTAVQHNSHLQNLKNTVLLSTSKPSKRVVMRWLYRWLGFMIAQACKLM